MTGLYRPPAFREDRPEVLHAAIAAQPLATLVTGAGGLAANLIPFTFVPDTGLGTLRAHLARANPQLAALASGEEALVIFHGPQAYVSPGWYETKREHGKVVPTWNYVVVEARGHPRLTDDAAWLRAQIDALTDTHERARADPWATTDAPTDFISAQLKGIVGLEIPLTHLTGKWKASQNRTPADRAGVAAGLTADGHPDLARLTISPP